MIDEGNLIKDFGTDSLVELSINMGNSPFFYKGYFISDDGNYIVFKDNKKGKITISKRFIITISKFGGFQWVD